MPRHAHPRPLEQSQHVGVRPRQRPVAVVDDKAGRADVFLHDEDAAGFEGRVGPLEEGDGVVFFFFFWRAFWLKIGVGMEGQGNWGERGKKEEGRERESNERGTT